MKVLYIADDGKEFEDEYECEKYEEIQKAKEQGFFDQIRALDSRYREIKLGDDLEDILQDTMYVKFDSLEAADYFNDQLYEYGLETIGYTTNLKENVVYAYNDNINEWESVTEKLEYYQDIFDKFTERETA